MRARRIIAIGTLVGIVLLSAWIYFKPSGTNSLGNRLSEYFYFTNTKFASEQKLIKEQARNARNKKSELRAFYKTLDWVRQKTLIDYQSEPRSAWNQIDENGHKKNNYLLYWQTIRPLIHTVYEKNIIDLKPQYPVVHFRCSDAPFIKHGYYHLTKSKSVQWMAQKIKERGFSKVTVLSCNAHLRQDKNSCAKYVNFYADIFKSSGIEVEFQCNSIVQDFSMMIYSPLLVSLNASSFSFMAGISKKPQDYISCNMGIESNNGYLRQTDADWILDHEEPLLHENVDDYNNVDDVLRKL
jgi:hypothetical protein